MLNQKEPLISIVIPNYNGERYLSRCLDSLRGQSYGNIEIIVVDNASSDSSISLLKAKYPDIRLVSMEVNAGFSAAVNAGIGATRGEFVIVLNNDTTAEHEFVRELYVALSEEAEAAMAAPKMLFARNPQTINSMGLGYGITGTNHDIGFGLKDGPAFNKREWIFGPCGGAGMYRRDLLMDVGWFDEDFFMYYEDVDYSFRAQLTGYKCIFVPTARVYHEEGGSGESLPKARNYYFARNSFAVILKNFPRRVVLRHVHLILWEMLKRTFSPLVRGDVSALLGYLTALGSMGQLLGKRREVQGRRKVPEKYIEEILRKNRAVLKQINLHGRHVQEIP